MKNAVLAAIVVAATLALSACVPSTPNFVQKVAMSNMYEIEAGKIASTKGKSGVVKQFGQHMVEAHSQTTAELKGIVEAEKINVTLPAKLDDDHQKLIEKLNEASAEYFDKTYADQQEEAHKEAVKLFESYAKDGDNAAVKAFAAKTLPVIKEHLQSAKKLEGGVS
jgi:putative membrane protein